MKKYDVIIIGAGIGGLTAGALLSRAGKKVLVLEKNPMVGGYIVNFKRGQFEFDASLHIIDGCDEGQGTYRILEKTGVLSKIKLLKPPVLYRSIYPDFEFQVKQNDPEGYLDTLIRIFPSESAGLRKIFKEMASIFYEIRRFLYSKINLQVEIPFFPIKYPHLFYYSNKSVKFMLDKYLNDERAKAVIAQLWGYYGLAPSMLTPFYFSYGWHDYLCNGGGYPKGGSGALADAFAEIIKEAGSEIMLNSEVQKIIVENRRARGVVTKKEEQFFSRVVVSNIDVRKTFFDLLSGAHLSGRLRKRITMARPSQSAFVVYLGLNTVLADKGVSEYEIFCNPSYDIEQQWADCESNNMDKVISLLTVYSNLDQDISPKGKTTMGIMTLSGYDFWKMLSKDEYRQKKMLFADIMIKRAERIIPKLSSFIEKMEIATPLTMERYTGNYKGAIYGASQLVSQSGIKRLSQETPIRNLYLVGAWTIPGEGISGVVHSGERIANKLMRVLK